MKLMFRYVQMTFDHTGVGMIYSGYTSAAPSIRASVK